MNIKRVVIDVFSVGVVVGYLELNYLHLVSQQPEIGQLMSLLLILPMLSVLARIIDKMNHKVLSQPVMMKLESKRYELTWRETSPVVRISDVPLIELIGNKPEHLQETLRTMLVEASRDLPRFTPSPLVIINSMLKLSSLEKEKLNQIVEGIGVLKVVIVESSKQAQDARMNITLPNLF